VISGIGAELKSIIVSSYIYRDEHKNKKVILCFFPFEAEPDNEVDSSDEESGKRGGYEAFPETMDEDECGKSLINYELRDAQILFMVLKTDKGRNRLDNVF